MITRARWKTLTTVSATLALVLGACQGAATPAPTATQAPATGPAASPTQAPSPEIGEVTFLSTQLAPTAEAEKMRTKILANFGGKVEFIGSETGPFVDQVRSEAQAGSGKVSLLGALHGDFAAFDPEIFVDLSDVAAALADLGVNEQYLELGKLGTSKQIYIPWMQATYIMAARKEALQYLPAGADLNALTWQQVTEWGRNITTATGERRLGFPAGEKGLLHRFFQGYAYPSFTGALNTQFATDAAIGMWQWLKDTWQYVNPQSTTYGFMQDPLRSGEVWVAWDHVARLIDALSSDPDTFVAFPSPAGPKGRGFMPVLAGLAIPKTAPNPNGAKELIKYLLQPETQATTLAEVAFFPVIAKALPGQLPPGIQLEQNAVSAQTNASDALPSLLPVGLGGQGGAYNQVFKDAFQQIIVEDKDPATVLKNLAQTLQDVLNTAGAACWPPDPASSGVCQVQ